MDIFDYSHCVSRQHLSIQRHQDKITIVKKKSKTKSWSGKCAYDLETFAIRSVTALSHIALFGDQSIV